MPKAANMNNMIKKISQIFKVWINEQEWIKKLCYLPCFVVNWSVCMNLPIDVGIRKVYLTRKPCPKFWVWSPVKVSCSFKTCSLSLQGSIIRELEEDGRLILECNSLTKYISISLACSAVWWATYCRNQAKKNQFQQWKPNKSNCN